MNPQDAAATRVTTRGLAWLFLAWVIFYAFLAPGFSSFETPTYELVLGLLRNGSLSFDQPPSTIFFASPEGRFYDPHEIGANLPLLFVAWLVREIGMIAGVTLTMRHYVFAGCFLGSLYIAVGLVTFFVLATRFYSCSVRRALWSTIVLGTGTQLLVYSGAAADVTLVTMLLMLLFAFLKAYWQRPRPGVLAMAFFMASLAVGTRITAAAVIPVLCAFVLLERRLGWTDRLAHLGAGLVALLPGAAWVLYYNWLRTGEPLVFPTTFYTTVRFDPSYYQQSLVGVLLSPSRGLLVMNPVLILVPFALFRWGRALWREVTLALAVFLLTLARAGASVNWHGGGGWGMRLYIYLIPLFFVPVAVALDRSPPGCRFRRAASGLWLLGLLINLSAMVTNWHYRQSLMGFDAIWNVNGQALDVLLAAARNVARLVGAPLGPDIVPGASAANVAASNSMSLWWLNLRFVGVPLSVCLTWGALHAIGTAVVSALGYRHLVGVRKGTPPDPRDVSIGSGG